MEGELQVLLGHLLDDERREPFGGLVEERAYTIPPAAPVLSEVRAGDFGIAEIVSPSLSQKVVLATSTHHPVSLGARAVYRMIKALVEKLRADGWPARYVSR